MILLCGRQFWICCVRLYKLRDQVVAVYSRAAQAAHTFLLLNPVDIVIIQPNNTLYVIVNSDRFKPVNLKKNIGKNSIRLGKGHKWATRRGDENFEIFTNHNFMFKPNLEQNIAKCQKFKTTAFCTLSRGVSPLTIFFL